MFPDFAEIRRSVRGAWELFLNRAGYVRWFTVTEAAFWHSFSVFFLILPLAIVSWQADFRSIDEAGVRPPGLGGANFHLISVFVATIDWLLFPVVLALLSSTLGISRHFAAFMIARNWGALLFALPGGALGLLALVGLLNTTIVAFATLVLFGLEVSYTVVNARWTLKANWSLAIGIGALSFLLTLALTVLYNRLLGLL